MFVVTYKYVLRSTMVPLLHLSGLYFLPLEKKIRYVVDFDREITEIITETKMMENLGFSVPEIARNVALQEDKYIQYVDGLKAMLKRYQNVLHSLDHAEVCRFVQ